LQFSLQAASPETFEYTLVRFTKYSSDQMKEAETGGAYSMHGRYEKCVQYFGWKTWRDHFEGL